MSHAGGHTRPTLSTIGTTWGRSDVPSGSRALHPSSRLTRRESDHASTSRRLLDAGAVLALATAPVMAASPGTRTIVPAGGRVGRPLGVRREGRTGADARGDVRHQRRPLGVAGPGPLHRAVQVHRLATAPGSTWTRSRSRHPDRRSRPWPTCPRSRCPRMTPRRAIPATHYCADLAASSAYGSGAGRWWLGPRVRSG